MGGKSKSVVFEGEIDDNFNIMVNQKNGEFIIIHNNQTKCTCIFCKKFEMAIVSVIENG